MNDKLFDIWAEYNPQWEKRYEESVIRNFCEYGKGATSMRDARGKLFGAGYEMLIIAFFIGLYYNQRRPLIQDSSKVKELGQPIKYWGSINPVRGRKQYLKLKEYIFIALVARTDIDYIMLEKGEITVKKVVGMLLTTMDEYINWGLHYIDDNLQDNPNKYYSQTAFLEEFLNIKIDDVDEDDEDKPESLD